MPQPPNLGALLQQAQKMQEEMMAAQEKLKDERVEASAGGGMVKVVMTGDLELKSLAIDPDAVDPEDVEMLQDMVHGRDQRGAAPGDGAAEQGDRRGRHGPVGGDGRARRPRRPRRRLGGGGGLPGGGAPNRAARRKQR